MTKRIKRLLPALLFCVIIIIGLLVINDYGVSTDEHTERYTLLVNVQYVLQRMNINPHWDLPPLNEYVDRYYGIFFQSPAILGELTAGRGGEYSVYRFRHYYTFFFCISGYFAFYETLIRVLRSRYLSILGTVMLAFYPRFFAEQFYNIKDLVFMSAWCWCLLASVLAVQNSFQIRYLLLFAIITAAATNCRFVAMIFPALMLLWYIAIRITKASYHKQHSGYFLIARTLTPIAITLLVYLQTYIVITPFLWEQPLRKIPEVIARFSDFSKWHGMIRFMGRVILDRKIPWYYIPVWLLISVPLWYLIFVTVEGIYIIRKAICWQKLNQSTGKVIGNPFLLYANLTAILPWVGTVVLHSTIYNAWRHFYFLMPCLILDAVFGIRHLEQAGGGIRAVERILIVLGLSFQLIWIVSYHPFEMTYFNGIGRFVAKDFDRDYWNMSKDVLLSEAIRREGDSLHGWSVTAPNDYCKYQYKDGTFQDIRYEVNAWPELDNTSLNTDYVMMIYQYTTGDNIDIPGYKEIYSINVDGCKISSLFYRQK